VDQWEAVLRRHVNARGQVDFAGIAAAPDPLAEVVAAVGRYGPPAGAAAALAHHINAYNALAMHGIVTLEDVPNDWLRRMPLASRVVRVTEPVVATSMDFRFVRNFTGLETFPEKGTVIGWQDGEPVRTPYPNCVLVMPSLRQLRPGVTVVRLGQLLD